MRADTALVPRFRRHLYPIVAGGLGAAASILLGVALALLAGHV